jgi:hypothetical protein
VLHGQAQMMQLLINSGAGLTTGDTGPDDPDRDFAGHLGSMGDIPTEPVVAAATYKDDEVGATMLRILLDAGAPRYPYDAEEDPALLAATPGNVACVRLLLAHKDSTTGRALMLDYTVSEVCHAYRRDENTAMRALRVRKVPGLVRGLSRRPPTTPVPTAARQR